MATIVIPAGRGQHMLDRFIKRAAERDVILDPGQIIDEATGQVTHWVVAHPDLTRRDALVITRACALKAAGEWPFTTLAQARTALANDPELRQQLKDLADELIAEEAPAGAGGRRAGAGR